MSRQKNVVFLVFMIACEHLAIARFIDNPFASHSNFAKLIHRVANQENSNTGDLQKNRNENDPSLDCRLMTNILTDMGDSYSAFFNIPLDVQDIGIDWNDEQERQDFACRLVDAASLDDPAAELFGDSSESVTTFYTKIMNEIEKAGGLFKVIKLYYLMETLVSDPVSGVFPNPTMPLQSNTNITLNQLETFFKTLVRRFGYYPFEDMTDDGKGLLVQNPEDVALAFYESSSVEDIANKLQQPLEDMQSLWDGLNTMTPNKVNEYRRLLAIAEPFVRFLDLSFRLGLLRGAFEKFVISSFYPQFLL